MSDQATILAVDDTAQLLALLVELLTPVGYRVRAVASGELALDEVTANRPDLILLDVRMKGLGGLEVCRRLKAREETRSIPVILMSGFADVEEWVEGLQLGAADYISKPFQPAELLTRVETHLALRQASVALERQRAVLIEANERLQREMGERQRVEDELRVIVDRAERARRAMLSALEDQKRVEAALHVERDNLHAFLAAAPAAILVLDAEGNVVHSNAAADRLFGRATPSAAGRRCGHLVNCVHRDDEARGCGFGPTCATCELDAAIKEALAGGEVRNREVEAELEVEGTVVRRLLVCNAAKLTLDGKPGAVLALHDHTDAHRARLEREALLATLAQSDRLASMGLLAAGVAHEINNPLAFVLYNLETLAKDIPRLADAVRRCHAALVGAVGDDGAALVLGGAEELVNPAMAQDAVERAHDAVSGAHRIQQIARGLGTFSRVERTELGAVDLVSSIEDALSLAHNEIKYRARVSKEFGPVPPVLASDGKLAQVFLNLFINAAHAIGEGRLENNEIRVRTWAEGEAVFVEVSDTGKGIAPAEQAKIFEPFFSTKGVGRGSGLGLFICRNIVTDFGGTISLASEVGKGTSFLVKLPRMQADSKPPSTAEPTPAPHPASAGPRGRILVVDDEPGIRTTFHRMLGRDHEVIAVSSGQEARTLLEGDRLFDVIYCDLMMPEVSGMELHAWLDGEAPELARRFVFVTGGAFTEGAADYLAKVGNRRVDKPFSPSSVRRLTAELVTAVRAAGK